MRLGATSAPCFSAQALKANPEGAPRELKLNSNYITRFGQVRVLCHCGAVRGSCVRVRLCAWLPTRPCARGIT